MDNKTSSSRSDKDIETLFREAVSLQQQGNLRPAVKKYKRILKDIPDHPQVLGFCGVATAGLGDMKCAERLFERAVAAKPDYAEGWTNLGMLRQQTGNAEGAAQAYDSVRRLQPGSVEGHLNFGNICQILGRFSEAVSAYETALDINPDQGGLWSSLARALLFEGEWKRALDATNRELALNPGHTGAFALKSNALLELGMREEWSELVDFDRFIHIADFEPPDSFPDLHGFNEALCTHCRQHPSLQYEPTQNTTKRGYQSGNLSLDENPGPVAGLLELIGREVEAYKQTRPGESAHPFLAAAPGDWTYDIWVTILGSQGHQAPHIHRSGWLSGCYYPKIPDVMSDNDDGQEGWIEFGRPQEYPLARAEPTVRAYPPHEGMVVLFPSYFYHRTIPFESDDERISIAFDIVPKR